MNEIKCPKCGSMFKIDEQNYNSILKQIRDQEFYSELKNREQQFENEKKSAITIAKNEIDKTMNEKINSLNLEILKLKNELKTKDELQSSILTNTKINTENQYKDEINKLNLTISRLEQDIKYNDTIHKSKIDEIVNKKEKNITDLKNKIELDSKEYKLKEQSLKDNYENKLKTKDEMIAYYKDLKAKQSTKMIGESLENHCYAEFNKLRPLFKNAYFEKDNDAKTGSKGDFIFRDYDTEGTEITSIMFEMKNEADMTATKHKNEDFLKELDKDRREKNCEYAVLVSLLEIDNEYYNNGIVDVSYRYPKMYVIRPQFFIPIITLIRSMGLNTLEYKKELELMRNQNIDISNFEENLNKFKDDFGRNYALANKKFKTAIEEIDKTIDHLQKTKEALLSSDKNLRIANDKIDTITIKKLTQNSKSVQEMFKNLQNNNSDQSADMENKLLEDSKKSEEQ